MIIRRMTREDIPAVVPIYLDYYNKNGFCWTEKQATRRIRQVVTMQDSLCLLAEENGLPVGFAMGYLEQYDDLLAYDLCELLVEQQCQNRGIGTRLMRHLEAEALAHGAGLFQLSAVNDEMHEHFYGKLGFLTATTLIPKYKVLK